MSYLIEETVSLTTSVELVDAIPISATATSGNLSTEVAPSPPSVIFTQSSRALVSGLPASFCRLLVEFYGVASIVQFAID